MTRCFIGLGSNLGDKLQLVQQAFNDMAQLPATRLVARSRLYSSKPLLATGDDYVNCVAELDTGLPAEELLRALQEIELRHGRQRSYQNAPRTLDLDILLYASLQHSSATLDLPHPRMGQRAFVLLPLLDLVEDIDIPGQGMARALLARLPVQDVSLLGQD